VRRLIAAALVAAAFPAAALGASTKKVQVGDDYYGPAKVTVKKGTKVKWTWLADNTDSHDVKLGQRPKGVKRFKSASAASDYSFSHKFTKKGTYKIVCTLHHTMRMTVVVK
jgi:plastocyanin